MVRAWAQQAGVALSDASTLELDAQRQQYVAYYGSEEAYLQQLALMGISEEAYDRILEDQYLYRDLYQAFCTPGSSLYADEATLTDYAAQLGYMGAYVLKLTGENAETMANDLLERWQGGLVLLAYALALAGIGRFTTMTSTPREGHSWPASRRIRKTSSPRFVSRRARVVSSARSPAGLPTGARMKRTPAPP